MEPVTATPTTPTNYATITATYGALLGAVVLAARDRPELDEVLGAELVPLGVATFALSKLVGKEKVESWLRAPFLEERPDGERRPKGQGLRYAVGELLSCTRCLGAWSGLALVGLRLRAPSTGRAMLAVLTASAMNDWLQVGFNMARSKANQLPG